MTVWIGLPGEQRKATYSERRGAFKGYVLDSLGIVVSQEQWDTWTAAGEFYELSDDAVAAILDEIGTELRRRAGRLPYIPSPVVLP
jgi:hypothetical protein